MMNDDNELKIEKPSLVGERLSHARKAKKLTIADVSTELRLTTQTIELIENEQWSKLHGRAYARGYISNYVRFLGLPEDDFLAAFNAEYTVTEPSLLVTRHQFEISNKKFVWLPSLLFIIVAVIVWLAYPYMQNTVDIVIDEASFISSDTLTKSTTLIDEMSKKNENTVAYSQLAINELEQLESADTEFLLNSGQSNDVSSDNSAKITNQHLNTVAVQDLAQQSNNDKLVDANIAVIAADAVLDLRFSGDCWIEVTDADDKVLLNKLMTRGDSIVLEGRTPLAVMLGRTSVAQVRFNDELFDPSAFTQRDVARFTLGAES
jgi:cytoskeleton protein RodZ